MRRVLLALASLALLSAAALSQDPGLPAAQAAQQAVMQTQQANLDAMRQAQQANEDATRQAQEANENATRQAQQAAQVPILPVAARPEFSLKPGSYSGPVTVKIREATRGASVYYTTDGWTPTADSSRYTGPVTLDSTTTLQAIAIAPHMGQSRILSGLYTIASANKPSLPATSSELPPTPTSGPAVLPKGTMVPLVFASAVSSKKADVGDKITLTVEDDVVVGGWILVRKGTPALISVTGAHKSGTLGVPGFVSFDALTLDVNGTTVKLRGTVTKQGPEIQANPARIGLTLVPAGVFLIHGKEAEVKAGSVLRATVAEDTPLPHAQ